MVYMNKNGAATLVAEKKEVNYATEVASPREMQSKATTSVAEKQGLNSAFEVESSNGTQQGAVTLVAEDNATKVASPF